MAPRPASRISSNFFNHKAIEARYPMQSTAGLR